MPKSGVEFLRKLNEENARIAARQTEETKQESVGVDPIRVQRMEDRRKRFGKLRAGPNSSVHRSITGKTPTPRGE